MNPEEFYNYEDRAYVTPTISRDEQLGFVDTLRDVVNQGNEQIMTQTEQLGTNVRPSLGGLTGSEGYFQQRYQTTPIEYQANTLKATAQAKALNDLMSNYAAQAKNRYQQAYRKAAKKSSGGSGGGGGNTSGWSGDIDDIVEDENNDDELTTEEKGTMPDSGWPEDLSVTLVSPINGNTSDGGTYGYQYYQGTKNGITGIIETDDPNYWQASNGIYYDPRPYMTDRTRMQELTDDMKRALADRIARSKGEL